MLAPLGLDPGEEDVYRQLVARRSALAAELAAATGRAGPEVGAALASLIGRGLAVASTSQGGVGEAVYVPAPPGVSLNALLRERQDELRKVEHEVAALVEEYRSSDLARDVIEVMTDVETVRRRFFQIQDAAREEVRSMVVPNLTVVPHRANTAEHEGMRRGVRYRVVVDRRALQDAPDMGADVRRSLARGQQIRIVDAVPVKMMIVDSETAMLPLHHDRHGSPASVLIHRSGLLAVLIAFFEAEWARAFPLLPGAAADEVVEERPGGLEEEEAQVLALLLAGLTDQAVAGQLDVSLRTVHRRVHQLMAKAGVESRIQLGWAAARRGWV